MLEVEVVATPELGDRSYVVHDRTHALVVDPQRDIERIEELLARLGLTCSLVVETHIHNDYVTGGLALAKRTGARYALSSSDHLDFDHLDVSDGDELTVGSLSVRVVATPGHTDDHVAYVVTDGATSVVLTGGSLLFGSVGRTDLVDPGRVDELTRAQYRSARRLGAELPDQTPVYPTHGFGSFCSSGSSASADESTIGVERSRNDAFVLDSEDEFVRTLVAGLTAYPSYYVHMAPLNRGGPAAVTIETPTPSDPAELGARVARGEWVVDLRARAAFAAEHLRGTIAIELGDNFSTYLGWILPWGAPLTLIGESPDDVTAAQRQLIRIGIDHVASAAVGTPRSLASPLALAHIRRVTFAELAAQENATILDVRRDDETRHGVIEGSTHVALSSLESRLDELPPGPLWVHCASGYRASIAASLLERAGREVVLVDDDFANARHVVSESTPAVSPR